MRLAGACVGASAPLRRSLRSENMREDGDDSVAVRRLGLRRESYVEDVGLKGVEADEEAEVVQFVAGTRIGYAV